MRLQPVFRGWSCTFWGVSGKVGPKRYPLRNRKFFGWNMEKFARISFAYCT
nr:MAG TPA: hypothetical protein [Caudoviricetes sp.]